MKFFFNIKELLTLKGAEEKQGRFITADDLSIIHDAAILENHGRIEKIGKKNEIENYISKEGLKVEKEDCSNFVGLPGFVDCHTHPVFNCNRFQEFEKRIEGYSYLEISRSGGGINATISGTRDASKAFLKEKTRKYFRSMMLQGTTTVEAKSGYGLSTDAEIKMLEVLKELNDEGPIQIVSTFMGAHAFPPEYLRRENEYVDLIISEMLPLVRERGLSSFCDVFCDRGFFSRKQTERIISSALDLGYRLTLHVDELADTNGASLAVDYKAISASHLLYINSRNIKKLAKSSTVGIMLPGTPFFLASKTFAPARSIIRAGGILAVSTDFNPGSNMCYCMPLTLTMAALFLKMTLPEVIVGGTYGGAKALGMDDQIGTLTRGKELNFALFDTSCYQEIFCHYGENHCRKTCIRGNVITTGR